jgi:hypothetical protein
LRRVRAAARTARVQVSREHVGIGRMNENRLGRLSFNNKSCRLRGAANAARTRIRIASEQDEEQDEEEEQVSVERRRMTRYY